MTGRGEAEFTQMQTVKFPFCCKVSTQVFETKCVQCNLHKKRAYTQLSLRRTPLGPASAVRRRGVRLVESRRVRNMTPGILR